MDAHGSGSARPDPHRHDRNGKSVAVELPHRRRRRRRWKGGCTGLSAVAVRFPTPLVTERTSLGFSTLEANGKVPCTAIAFGVPPGARGPVAGGATTARAARGTGGR